MEAFENHGRAATGATGAPDPLARGGFRSVMNDETHWSMVLGLKKTGDGLPGSVVARPSCKWRHLSQLAGKCLKVTCDLPKADRGLQREHGPVTLCRSRSGQLPPGPTRPGLATGVPARDRPGRIEPRRDHLRRQAGPPGRPAPGTRRRAAVRNVVGLAPAGDEEAVAGVLQLPVAADGRRVAARGFPHEVLGVAEVRPVAWVAAPHRVAARGRPPCWRAMPRSASATSGVFVGSGRPAARQAAAIAAAALRTVASFDRSARPAR